MRDPRLSRIAKRGPALALTLLALIAPAVLAQVPTTPPPEAAKGQVKKAQPKKARVKPGDEAPVVMSSEAMARRLSKPDDRGRYDGEPDWDQLPPWRRASFFGVKAEGQLFLYVVDCSGSMDDGDRLERAKAELRRSVNALQSPQRFKVIFYHDRPVPMPGELPRPADHPSKMQLANWLPLVQPGGETDPRGSLAQALTFRPDAVFLLSDGDFPEGTVEAIAGLNPRKIPIHCVDLADGAAGDGLRKIAAESGGKYVARGR